MRLCHALLLVSCALPAQFASAEGEALLVKTADPTIATGLAQTFALEMPPEIPALPAGGHFVVAVAADGALTVTTGEGDVGIIDLAAKPAILLDLYADQLAGVRMMMSMMASQSAAQSGTDEKTVNDAMGAAFDFPKQIDLLALVVRGDETAGYKAALEFTPVKDTGFAAFVGNMKPGTLGAPVLGDGKSAIEGFVSLDSSSLKSMFNAMKGIMNTMGGMDSSALKSMDQLIAYYDGAVGFSMNMNDAGANFLMVAGVTDTAAMNAVYDSADYRAGAETATKSEQMKMTMKWDAYEHRGVKVHQSLTEMANADMMGPNPIMKDGVMASEFAVGGDYFITTMNGGDGGTKAALDRALDGKITRKQLPQNVVIALSIKLRELIGLMGQGVDAADAPENVFVDIGARQNVFRIGVNVK